MGEFQKKPERMVVTKQKGVDVVCERCLGGFDFGVYSLGWRGC